MADPVAPDEPGTAESPEPGTEVEPAAPASEEPEPLPHGRKAAHRGYGKHFLVVYLLLGVILGAAVAGFVVVLTKPDAPEGPAWSAWEPAGDEAVKAQQIADFVSAGYRLPSGQQLVGIQASPPRVQDVPIGAIAVRKLPSGPDAADPVNVFAPDGVVVYILCGLGEKCAIEEGEPSAERLRLLRREALELALYTFRYVDGTNSVVAFLPPRPGDEPTFALLFERGDFDAQLDQPLAATLPNTPPAAPENIAPLEVQTIDRLTTSNFFRFSFQQLQDGTAVLVLDDPRLPEQSSGTETGSGTDTGTQDEGGATTGSTDEAGVTTQ